MGAKAMTVAVFTQIPKCDPDQFLDSDCEYEVWGWVKYEVGGRHDRCDSWGSSYCQWRTQEMSIGLVVLRETGAAVAATGTRTTFHRGVIPQSYLTATV